MDLLRFSLLVTTSKTSLGMFLTGFGGLSPSAIAIGPLVAELRSVVRIILRNDVACVKAHNLNGL